MSLDPRTQALLARAKGGFEPTARDAVAVEAALIAAVGVTAAGAATGAGGAAKLATLGSATMAKAVAALVVVSGVVAGIVTFAPQPPAEQRTTTVPVAATSSLIAEPPVTGAAPLPVAVEESDEPPAAPLTTARPRIAPPAAIATAVPRAAEPPNTSVLRDELALVREGASRLHAGNAVGALATFDAHAETFPNGVLEEERCAGRVLALCALGRTSDARDQARALRATHPGSAHASRIRESCVGAW